jgi:hypothetical protein
LKKNFPSKLIRYKLIWLLRTIIFN